MSTDISELLDVVATAYELGYEHGTINATTDMEDDRDISALKGIQAKFDTVREKKMIEFFYMKGLLFGWEDHWTPLPVNAVLDGLDIGIDQASKNEGTEIDPSILPIDDD